MAALEDTILILFPDKQCSLLESGIPEFWAFASAHRANGWGYGHTRNRPVIVLPESWKAERGPLPEFEGVAVVSYSNERSIPLPKERAGDVWILDGTRESVVDWDFAHSAAHRRECDVLVFGTDSGVFGLPYAESVRVDAHGQVLGFTRHYADSPASADPWCETASALVCDPADARAVVAHVMFHGWEMDSIGGLTRRFHVGWSNDMNEHRRDYGLPFGVADRQPGSQRWNGVSSGGHLKSDNGFINLRTGKLVLDQPRRNPAPKTATVRRPRWVDPPMSLTTTSRQHPDATALASAADASMAGSDGEAETTSAGWGYRFAKRTLDVVASATVLLALSPFLFVVAILVKLTSRGPVLFGHVRQGLGGREFRCLKFRTMVKDADAMQAQLRGKNEVDGPQFKISNDPRLTWLGARIQRLNIDEIPQFINVLRGDMSLVGPRPSPDKENQFCPGWRRARLSVRPGVTGLWQVLRLREKSHSDFQEWIYYDLEYVRHRSMWLDLQLLMYTPVAMFAGSRLGRFAERLQRRGICVHSAQIARNSSSSRSDGSDSTLVNRASA